MTSKQENMDALKKREPKHVLWYEGSLDIPFDYS